MYIVWLCNNQLKVLGPLLLYAFIFANLLRLICKLYVNFTFQLPSQTGSTKSYQVMKTLICLHVDESGCVG